MPTHPTHIAIGCDASKGRIDIVIKNQSGTNLAGGGGYDDTRAGHERLRKVIDDLYEANPDTTLLVGIESTGGMERNWLAFFRQERRWVKPLKIHHLNALSVSRYRESDLRQTPGDMGSAEAIATFLLERCVLRRESREEKGGSTSFYRTIRAMVAEQVHHRQRLMGLMVVTHPELVRFTHHKMPDWIYLILDRYPTALHLSRGRTETIAAIPHVGKERAKQLVAAAKESVASCTDEASAATVRLLVQSIRHLDDRIEFAKEMLVQMLGSDEQMAQRMELLTTVPVIGKWTAACLAIEIGDVSRFSGPRALVAWAGLDPVIEASGDDVVNRGISHRGNVHIRAVLFMAALNAIQHSEITRDFYQRLVARGKPRKVAIIAVMTKILRTAHAILVTGKPFDAEYAKGIAARNAALRQDARAGVPSHHPAPVACDSEAPVSRQEAKRRRLITASQAFPAVARPLVAKNTTRLDCVPDPGLELTSQSASGLLSPGRVHSRADHRRGPAAGGAQRPGHRARRAGCLEGEGTSPR